MDAFYAGDKGWAGIFEPGSLILVLPGPYISKMIRALTDYLCLGDFWALIQERGIVLSFVPVS